MEGGKNGLSDECSDPTEAASVVGMVVGTTHQKNEEWRWRTMEEEHTDIKMKKVKMKGTLVSQSCKRP